MEVALWPNSYLSKMSSVRTPSFCSSNSSIVKKSNKKSKNRGKLWGPVRGWINTYRCQTCWNIMSRKDDTKAPQEIYSCGHVVCANCIAKSYFVDLNHMCPVSGCSKCVNPKITKKVSSVAFSIESDTQSIDSDESCYTHSCGCVDVCYGFCDVDT